MEKRIKSAAAVLSAALLFYSFGIMCFRWGVSVGKAVAPQWNGEIALTFYFLVMLVFALAFVHERYEDRRLLIAGVVYCALYAAVVLIMSLFLWIINDIKGVDYSRLTFGLITLIGSLAVGALYLILLILRKRKNAGKE